MKAAFVLGNSFALSAVSATVRAKSVDNGTENAATQVLRESMGWTDMYYDAEVGYLYNLDSKALLNDTRSSAWYAAGLLARNEGNDAEEAAKIVKNIIVGQHKNVKFKAVGYGTMQLALTYLPTSGTGTTRSTRKNPRYRVGGVNDDILYPSYSIPAIMRAFMSGWVGRKLNDSNMTSSGEAYAKDIVTLFDRADILSEFNSGTYAGVSLYALTLWAKYLPPSSLMGQHGADMIGKTWATLGRLSIAHLKNVAGPWDRSYVYDMERYLSIFALHIWTLVGKADAPINAKPWTMGHKDDFAIGPLIAILAPFHNTLVPKDTLSALRAFPGPHANLTIGAETFSENVIGGPAKNPSSFNPPVVQWSRKDASVGWLTLYAQTEELRAVASDGILALEYPQGNETSTFTFLVGQTRAAGRGTLRAGAMSRASKSVSGSRDICNLLTCCCDFEFWNFTYGMPEGSGGIPQISLSFELE
ncbi:hypothetical protein PMIN05_010746 [Paraphaeosphaeria minitans]